MKKNKSGLKFVLSSILLLAFLLGGIQSVYAGAGGEAAVKAGITLYGEFSSSSSEEPMPSTTSDSKQSGSVSSSTDKPTKPIGKYPSTGELVKRSLTFSGILLLIGAMILFFYKKKKEAANGGRR